MINKTTDRLIRMVQLAVLVALVIVLQLIGSFIHIGPTSVSLVLIPIALGGMIFGPSAGALLGLTFGLMTLIAGITGTDGFTYTLFSIQPVSTIIICLGKATLAGLCGGLVYRLLEKRNKWLATFVCAATVPVVNTGLFILGGLTLVRETLESTFVGEGSTIVYFLFIVCAGLNFIAEFLFNMVLSPALYRLYDILTATYRNKHSGNDSSDAPETDPDAREKEKQDETNN